MARETQRQHVGKAFAVLEIARVVAQNEPLEVRHSWAHDEEIAAALNVGRDGSHRLLVVVRGGIVVRVHRLRHLHTQRAEA